MKNLEIEFKYPALVSLSDFRKFCESKNPLRYQIISGFDHFYSSKQDSESFYRHRVNTNENQLTYKRKLSENNSFIREEHNIDLPLATTEDQIAGLCQIHQYTYNSTIYKNCFIYTYDYYVIVYYVCYDQNLQELGRFIEIELREDINWSSKEEAYGELVTLEKLAATPLRINERERVKKSLFEMFRKE